MDRLSPAHRSWNMSRIRARDTKPELAVRSALHQLGYRFRLRKYRLPGKPDVVLVSRRTVVFVHGCFWHRHGCKYSYTPKSNLQFWLSKFEENKERDRRTSRALRSSCWNVVVVWECQTYDRDLLTRTLKSKLRSLEKTTPDSR
jgi:DNA mismatch endonuclease, patch repair protein